MADVAEIKFESEQWEKVLKTINKRWGDLEQRRNIGGLFSAYVFKDVMSHFANESGPDAKWEPWSDLYGKHLEKLGRSGNKILQYNGRLRQSFTPTNWRAVSEGVLFYNNAKTANEFPYAAAHDEGGPKLPQRKFMWLSDKAVDDMLAATLKFLAGEKSGTD